MDFDTADKKALSEWFCEHISPRQGRAIVRSDKVREQDGGIFRWTSLEEARGKCRAAAAHYGINPT